MLEENTEAQQTEVTTDPIEAAVKAMETAGAQEEEKEVETPEVQEEPEPEEEPRAEEEPEAEEPEEKVENENPSQLQVIASKEERLRELNQQLKKDKEEFYAEQQELVSQLQEFDKVRKTGSVADLLKLLGVENLAAAAEELYMHELGEDAPTDLVAGHKTSVLMREIEELKRQMAEDKQGREEREQQATAENNVQEYVSTLGGHLESVSDSMPYLKVAAERDSEGTLQDMWQIACQLYEDTQEVPTPQEVAEALEEGLKETVRGYEALLKPEEKKKPEKKTKAASKTLSSQRTAQKANHKPSNEELSEDEQIDKAIQAMEEASKLEASQ